MRIAGGEHSRHARPMLVIRSNVSAAIQLNGEICQQLALYRSGESHSEQDEIRLELELGAGHAREVAATIGEDLPLETDAMEALHSAVFAGERRRGNAPLALAPFLMRM